MRKRNTIVLTVIVFLLIFFGVPAYVYHLIKIENKNFATDDKPGEQGIFKYEFSDEEILMEAGSIDKSTSPLWWLDSGGMLYVQDDIGQTVHGELRLNNYWRTAYANSNALDTDGGLHPQNIFRLVTKYNWHNLEEEAYFRIDSYNVSISPNRSESNGIFLFGRYQDADNLYYAGLRVDGHVVIKKKIRGAYHTLALERVYPGEYDRISKPIVIPLDLWIGLRVRIETIPDDIVRIQLYTDVGRTGEWTLVLEALDDVAEIGPILDNRSHAGIRTDFMDVSMDDFLIREIDSRVQNAI